MSRFYTFNTRTGELQSDNTVSYADSLPKGCSEVEIEPKSKWHTVWNPVTHILDDNGGGRIKPDAEIYLEFTGLIKRVYSGYQVEDRDAILRVSSADLKAVLSGS